tara:strand:+ start:1741 stop:1911 length:171 start_codon:yes stop_codon:yes gene_type:complete
MAKISSEGIEKLVIVKNALDSMFDKLEKSGTFGEVQEEFQAIADIISEATTWQEVR